MRPEHWLFTIPLRLRSLFSWAQADQELDDELRDHLERKSEEYVAQRKRKLTAAPASTWEVSSRPKRNVATPAG